MLRRELTSAAVAGTPATTRLLFHVSLALPLLALSLSTVLMLAGRLDLMDPIRGLDVRITVGVVVVVSLVYFLLILLRGRHRLEPFTVFLALLVGYGAVVGLLHMATGTAAYTWRSYGPHLMAGLLILGGFSAISASSATSRGWILPSLNWYSGVTLIVVAFYLTAFTLDWLARDTYWGPSTGSLLLPTAWYFANRRWRLASLAAFLIIINGKRGPAVALIALTLAALWLTGRRSGAAERHRLAIVTAGVIVVCGAVGVWAVSAVDRGAAPAMITATVLKWTSLNTNDENFDIALATSGRSLEVEEAFSEFAREPVRWISGTGYGWTYVQGIDDRGHYLHFSPLNMVLQYGVPLAIVFFTVVFLVLRRGFRYATTSPQPDPVLEGLLLLVIASLVEGLFAYMYAVNPILWISLGAIAGLISRPPARLPISAAPTRRSSRTRYSGVPSRMVLR